MQANEKVRPALQCQTDAEVRKSFNTSIPQGTSPIHLAIKMESVVLRDPLALDYFPEIAVEECYRLAGEWCILLKVRIATPEHSTKILDRIWQLEGVIETSTTFVISTIL